MRTLFLPLTLLGLVFSGLIATAQPVADEEGDVVVGTNIVDPSALLDLVATDKGMLVPRMTTAERDAIAAPAEGLLIYNIDDFNFYVWSSASGTPQWDAIVTTGNRLAWLTEGNIDLVDGTDNFLGTTDATPVRLITDNTERITIEVDGDVGINQVTPTAQLEVVGDGTDPAIEANVTTGTAIVARSSSTESPNPALNTGLFATVPSGLNNTAILGIAGTGAPFSVIAGVAGANDGGYGVVGNSVAPGFAGVYGQATSLANPATGVRGTSRAGRAGVFEILDPANTSNAVEISTAGTGDALHVSATGGGDAINATGNIVPGANNTYNLGSSLERWDEIFVNGISSIHLGVDGDEAHITYNDATDIFGLDFNADNIPEFTVNDQGVVTANQIIASGIVPIGGIIMWSGTTPPQDYYLCDGTNGTPNLIGKFVLGTATPGANGNGTTTNGVLTSSTDGAHTHSPGTGNLAAGGFALTGIIPTFPGFSLPGFQLFGGLSLPSPLPNVPAINFPGFNIPAVNPNLPGPATTTSDGDHTHTTAVPYYALAYIMRYQ